MTDDKQSNRSFKHLADRFFRKVESDPNKVVINPNEFDIGLSQFLDKINTCLQENNGDFKVILDGIEARRKAHKTGTTDPTTAPTVNEVSNHWYHMKKQQKLFYEYHQTLVNEEAAINRIESRAHLRTTLWRTLATILFGTSILGVYSGAFWMSNNIDSFKGFTLPLSRCIGGS